MDLLKKAYDLNNGKTEKHCKIIFKLKDTRKARKYILNGYFIKTMPPDAYGCSTKNAFSASHVTLKQL